MMFFFNLYKGGGDTFDLIECGSFYCLIVHQISLLSTLSNFYLKKNKKKLLVHD